MRILYVYNINQVAKTDGENMVQRGHTVTIYEPDLAGGTAPWLIRLSRMPERLLDLRHIIGHLNPKDFDLVHIHWASYGILGLISQIPVIIECHGSDVRYRLHKPFFRSVLTQVFHKAAAVLCITPDILKGVQSVRPDALFVPGPVDTQRFAPLETELSIPTEPWTILLFARLNAIKGPEIATQGIASFIQRHPEVRVQLLDWGLLKEEYKTRYGKYFEFLPLLPAEEVQHLIRSADVVVGQCLVGALGLAELQAMSCAKPVIASFRHDEAYPASPPLCRITTSQEVDEHLEYLFTHRDKGVDLGLRAREWVIAHHSQQARINKLEEIYSSILHERWNKHPPLVTYPCS